MAAFHKRLTQYTWRFSSGFLFNQSSSQFHTTTFYQRTQRQIIRQGPVNQKKKNKGPLSGLPHLKGIVLSTFTMSPKKPNSAQRKCCKVRLSTGIETTAFIPKEGHNLQEHNVVLVEQRGCKDLPGVNIRVVRGKYDCAHPVKNK